METSIAERWRSLASRIPHWSIAAIQRDLQKGRGAERFDCCTVKHLGGRELISPEMLERYETALGELIQCDPDFTAISTATGRLKYVALLVSADIGQRERLRAKSRTRSS